jgi:glycosyltransferase involved in cell wall biosynthesis
VKVLIVSGIWPPDVGGPASHAPEVAEFLVERGHSVDVVTTAASRPADEAYPIGWVPRSAPRGVRHVLAARLIAAHARKADVVYTTGMVGRSALGARSARRPYVMKLTADPAFERARRRGIVLGDLDEFQRSRGGVAVWMLRRYRNLALRGASHVFCPSDYLRRLAIDWGVEPKRVTVLPNPAPPVPELPSRDELRRRLGLRGRTLAFAGRLTTPKSLGTLLEAVTRLDGVDLLIAGEGPDRAALEQRASSLGLGDRVRFLGALPRPHVLELFRAADASVLTSTWENFPHSVVEALAVGTPVIATAVGGVAEIVRDGENGLLVAPGDPEALARAVTTFFEEPELQARLRATAAGSVERFAPLRIFGELEAVLERVSRS